MASPKSVTLFNIRLFSWYQFSYTLGSLSGTPMEVSEHQEESMLYWLIRSWEAPCGEFEAN